MRLKQVDRFHRLKELIPQMIKRTIDKSETVHGGRAINQQIGSPHLRTQTRDYDVYSYKPRRSAADTEKYLDEKFGYDAFDVQKGKRPGVFKVKSKATGETYVDFVQQEKKIPYKLINGIRYATLDYHKKHAQKTLREGTATHRKQMDIDMINRIKLSKQQNLRWRI